MPVRWPTSVSYTHLAVGFGWAGQLAHQLEGKRDRAVEAVAGGDAAVYDDFLIVDDGTGQLVLKSGVGGGVPAFQQAEDVYKRQTRCSTTSALTSRPGSVWHWSARPAAARRCV